MRDSSIAWSRYGWAAGIVALSTGVASLLAARFELTNLVMIYLLGVAFAGMRLGRGPAVFAVLLSVLSRGFLLRAGRASPSR
ncbi:MAG: DUF4118 domain-containing protein [Pseudomonadota bacterium]